MNNNVQGEGKFFNGFLLGLLVGAAVVFLFGTKKGKRLLKAISEEKLDSISDLFNEAKEDGGTFAQKEPSEEAVIERPRVRRFFKGISRRIN